MISIGKTDIRDAQTAPAWCGLDGMSAKDALEDCIKHAYTLKGIQWSFDTLRIAAQELGTYLTRKYDYLTMGEIRLALDSGVRGELGNKDTFVTIANMQTWVRIYAECQERMDVLEQMHEERTKKRALPEPEEDKDSRNRRMWEERPQSLFRYTRENGTIWSRGQDDGLAVDKLGAMIWDMLEREGVTREEDGAVSDRDMVEWYETRRNLPMAIINSSAEDRRKCLQLERCFKRLIAEGRELEYRVA